MSTAKPRNMFKNWTLPEDDRLVVVSYKGWSRKRMSRALKRPQEGTSGRLYAMRKAGETRHEEGGGGV